MLAMKKLFIPVALTASIVLLASCHGKKLRGKGEKVTNQVAITAVDDLDIEASVKTIITVTPGAQPSLKLMGYGNILQHIKTSVQGNKLRVYTDLDNSWSIDKHDGTTIELVLPSLANLDFSGASDAEIHGSVTGPKFHTSISGSGKLVADNISSTEFSTEISGAADVDVKGGTVQKVDYEISGAGKVSSFPLQAADVSVSISGAAKADITAIHSLTVSISGAGKIKYKGHPTITKDISGAGSIRDVN